MNIMPLVVGWRDVGDDAMAAALYANLSTQLFEGPFHMWMEKTAGGGGAAEAEYEYGCGGGGGGDSLFEQRWGWALLVDSLVCAAWGM